MGAARSVDAMPVSVSEFAGTGSAPSLRIAASSPPSDAESGPAGEVFAGFGNRVEVGPRITGRQVVTIAFVASLCWLTVFAAGHALLG